MYLSNNPITLNLSDHQIGLIDIHALATTLSTNHSVTSLNLSDSSLGPDDAQALANAMFGHTNEINAINSTNTNVYINHKAHFSL
jgi:Ran GTPase-activating protein (RanGAP) involved in mRNA processing and transport